MLYFCFQAIWPRCAFGIHTHGLVLKTLQI